jgi:hypothetical protein
MLESPPLNKMFLSEIIPAYNTMCAIVQYIRSSVAEPAPEPQGGVPFYYVGYGSWSENYELMFCNFAL